MVYTFREYSIRPDMLEALEAYIHEGRPPGGFLFNILSNQLVGAVAVADDDNLRNIQAYAAWLYERCPEDLWGSKEAVREHIKRCQDRREREARLLDQAERLS